MESTGRTNEKLWEESKTEAIKRMGGKFSARAMQLATRLYQNAGGGYIGRKTQAQKDLTKWTGEDWRTKSGLPSKITGERYLPSKVIKALTDKEYKETTKAKIKGTKEGKQFVKQPKKIVEKIKKIKSKIN
jgi:hypothetical protein